MTATSDRRAVSVQSGGMNNTRAGLEDDLWQTTGERVRSLAPDTAGGCWGVGDCAKDGYHDVAVEGEPKPNERFRSLNQTSETIVYFFHYSYLSRGSQPCATCRASPGVATQGGQDQFVAARFVHRVRVSSVRVSMYTRWGMRYTSGDVTCVRASTSRPACRQGPMGRAQLEASPASVWPPPCACVHVCCV